MVRIQGYTLCSHLTHCPSALEKLAARIMEQAGVIQEGSLKEGPLSKIRGFTNRFLNADSVADDIAAYRRELDAITNDVRVRITRETLNRANIPYQIALAVNISVTVNRLDKKVDNLKALIFLEGKMWTVYNY